MFRCRRTIWRSGTATSTGRQRAGRHLVGERLEEVEVLPVDQRHLDVGAAEAPHREDSGEPTSDDNDALSHLREHCAFELEQRRFTSSPPA